MTEQKEKLSDQLNIAVTGLGRSVGTTFVATALAFYYFDMGKSVTFVQCLTPSKAESLFFDAVAMDQRFARRTFHDYYERICSSKPTAGMRNTEEGIHWILPTSCGKTCFDLNPIQKGRLISAAKGEVCIFDIEADDEWNHLLLDMDMIVVITDPLPSRMICRAERFKRLKKMELSGHKILWVVNRMNDGVNKRQVRSYLKTSQIIWIPLFSADKIYQCEYNCRFIWKDAEIKREILEIFTKVSQFHGSL